MKRLKRNIRKITTRRPGHEVIAVGIPGSQQKLLVTQAAAGNVYIITIVIILVTCIYKATFDILTALTEGISPHIYFVYDSPMNFL